MNIRANRRQLAGLLVVSSALAWAVGCERGGPSSSEPDEKPSVEQAEKRASDEERARSDQEEQGWRQLSEQQLDEPARQKLKRARQAQKALGSTLKEELVAAIGEEKPAGAVDFCHERAPEIAREVSETHDLKIGRTSHKLRNPDNAPPSWAEEAVDRKEARTYVLEGPEEQLGYLAPIKVGGVCVNCHGKQDQLAPGVSERLDKHYPKDQATGFEVGDLRGWFWVEVPAS